MVSSGFSGQALGSSTERLAEEESFDHWHLAFRASFSTCSLKFGVLHFLSTGPFSAIPLYHLDSGAWDVGLSVVVWSLALEWGQATQVNKTHGPQLSLRVIAYPPVFGVQ